jgi:hypothetical protein
LRENVVDYHRQQQKKKRSPQKRKTEQEKQKLGKDIAVIIVAIGGILTLSYAIYFIVDTLKNWY